MMMMPEDMIGAIKIKDGLFIGDEFSAQVSCSIINRYSLLYLIERILNLIFRILNS